MVSFVLFINFYVPIKLMFLWSLLLFLIITNKAISSVKLEKVEVILESTCISWFKLGRSNSAKIQVFIQLCQLL